MFQSMLSGQSYRQRDGADDPDSYHVLASAQWDDSAGGAFTVYTPETGTQSKQDFIWSIRVGSIVNEDSGESILVMTNYFMGRILHTDVITFDIKFRSASEITAGSNTVLGPNGFDQATCSLQNDTRNKDFWIVTVTDGHCDTGTPTTCISDVVSTKTNRGQDWFVEDDDVDLSNHLCVPPDDTENWGLLEESYFAC